MKTDYDAFVHVDEVLASLTRANVTYGLLYGLIENDERLHRSPDSKWYISPEEWPESTYPPWAHGHGYVVLYAIAKTVAKRHKDHLKMFKLEDVAMTCIQFNPVDDSYFISGSIDGKVRIWGVCGKRVVDWAYARDVITVICYHPYGNVLFENTIYQ